MKIKYIYILFCFIIIFNKVTAQNDSIIKKSEAIINFIKFINWKNKDILNIKVWKNNKMTEILKSKNNKYINIKTINKLDDIDNCKVLYISNANDEELEKIVKKANSKHILTISDNYNHVNKNVIISFKIEQGETRFQINRKVAMSSEIEINYLLYKQAKVVID